MMEPGQPGAALSTQDMLEAEHGYLYEAAGSEFRLGGSVEQRAQALHDRIHALDEERAPWALCLSGGGIRSATLGLGVLQGLARRKLLGRFTYLSTVSGGGYIGSWLSRWIAQAGGNVAAVEQALQGCASASGAAREPVQVSRLRAYSNYLSPKWGLSADFFTLVAIVLRNLLLNGCVLLPLIAAVMLLPQLYLGLLGADADTLASPLLVVTALCLIVGNGYAVADLPPGEIQASQHPPPHDRYLWLCLLPIVLAAILLGVVVRGQAASWAAADWRGFAGAGAVLQLLGYLLGQIWQRRRYPGVRPPGSLRSGARSVLLVLSGGAAAGSLAWLLADLTRRLVSDEAGLLWYATLAVPLLLSSFWLAMTLYVGLVRQWSSENDREWWARCGGWWIKTSLCWIAGFALAVHAPLWLLAVVHAGGPGGEGVLGEMLGAGGVLGLATGLIGYWSKNGATLTRRARGLAAVIGVRVLDLAALVFIALLLAGISLLLGWLLQPFADPGSAWSALTPARYTAVLLSAGGPALLAFVSLLAVAVLWSWCVGVNTFSLHSMYGNRLTRAYLGAARAQARRHPHGFTGFDDDDNLAMTALRTHPPARLFHVLNLTLNLVAPSGDRLEWQQRKAASFSVSPLHAGSALTGYAPAEHYAGSAGKGISLARAMTISGAAASPNMGYHSSPAVTFVMALFNVRLGWWLPNPGRVGERYWHRGEPGFRALGLLVAELLGLSTARRSHVSLSDGGHFENLGLYEMVRRRCRRILVVDAGADAGYEHADLQEAIRKIRVDLGIAIEFPLGSFQSPQRCIVGTIRYGDADPGAADGVLCCLKPVLCGDEPLDVQRYAAASRKRDGKQPFPQQSTADQFFDEAQFESYRMLGEHLLTRVFPSSGAWPR